MPLKLEIPIDASEAELQECLQMIVNIAKEMESHGFTPEIRAADRGSYWKWCHAEKAMNALTSMIDMARMHIAAIDHSHPPTGIQ